MAKKANNDAPGMAGQRARTDDGTLREKRGDTHIGTIEGAEARPARLLQRCFPGPLPCTRSLIDSMPLCLL